MPLTRATILHSGKSADDHVPLDYEGRFLRRRKLTSQRGRAFLVDLPETRSLDDGDVFELEDGSFIEVRAAPEPLYAVTGPNLARLAWHIGNRHTPARIEERRILIRADHVLARMLEGLGASIEALDAPFQPEGGAYGAGRTLGHAHTHEHTHADATSGGRAAERGEGMD